MTSASKHIEGDQYDKVRVHPARLARLIAERTPLKVSKAQKSNIIWLRRQKASAGKPKDTSAVMEFVLAALIAGALVPITQTARHGGEFVKGSNCV